jgi:hypothetical protein
VDELWAGVNARPALLEAAEAAQRLRETAGMQAVRAVLDREIAMIDRQLEGPVTDPSDYPRLLGRKSGLTAIDGAIDAICERATKRRAEGESEARASDAGESATER